MEELVLRIQAVLKRTMKSPTKSTEISAYSIGRYVFDYENQFLRLQDRSTTGQIYHEDKQE